MGKKVIHMIATPYLFCSEYYLKWETYSAEEVIDIVYKLIDEINKVGAEPGTLQLNTIYLEILADFYNYKNLNNATFFGMKLDHSYAYPLNRISIQPRK